MEERFAIRKRRKAVFLRGLAACLPLMLSYTPVAIAFGVVAKQSGMHLFDIMMLSILVYAGAAQFMGVNMLSVGAGFLEIVIATFVLNFRHFVMSFSFMNGLRQIPLKQKGPLALGLTDETFAVSAIHKEEADEPEGILFYAALILSAYLSWIIGTAIGGLLGDVIPEKISQSMGIALYAMFIGLLVPSVKKEWRVGLIAVFAMALNFLFSQFLSGGWAIVCGTIIGGAGGILILKEREA